MMRNVLITASLCLLAACAANPKKNEVAKPAPAPVQTPVVTPAPTVPAPAPAIDATPPMLPAEKIALFVTDTSKKFGIPENEIRATLAQAQYRQSIIDAITRPAEAKPWKTYRPIFLTEARINNGRKFLAEHRVELQRVQDRTGVPAEIIVAIIGVETSYGGNMGNYKVLDALYTLGFYYPKREAFFSSELAHLFQLSRVENFDIQQLKGSYAGAMGYGQFMPSSYLNYAKDGDNDGRRNLFGNLDDVFSSVANYFVGHGWQKGEPVFVRASMDSAALPFVPDGLEAKYSLAELAQKGYRPISNVPDLPATLLTLDGSEGTEHWIGFKNFYVITRYNRSPLYAMSVYQLAQAIAEPVSITPVAQ
ncbi:MAG: lytic murein transglycosylase B [Arenimonas sp.]